ncbi:MAG: 3-phosphoserine/phosphohydroxythreonine transaminase, partial [Bacilli bacterium]
KSKIRTLLNIDDSYEILFLQGGASLQFAMIPMNFASSEKPGYYVVNGSWGEKALEEAEKLGVGTLLASSKEDGYRSVPAFSDIPENASYVHITSNETIQGTQFKDFPTLNVPLIADMSSDIFSTPFPIEKFDIVYAGAQKNLGPSGVTLVIIKKTLLEQQNKGLATMLNYATHIKNDSLYNTPPTFGIYLIGLVADWILAQNGLQGIAQKNAEKANALYNVIDASNGYFAAYPNEAFRSHMNVSFTLPTEEATKAFLQEAKELGFVGLAGHRSVGGCRASIYNAVNLESCLALADFMKKFQAQQIASINA